MTRPQRTLGKANCKLGTTESHFREISGKFCLDTSPGIRLTGQYKGIWPVEMAGRYGVLMAAANGRDRGRCPPTYPSLVGFHQDLANGSTVCSLIHWCALVRIFSGECSLCVVPSCFLQRHNTPAAFFVDHAAIHPPSCRTAPPSLDTDPRAVQCRMNEPVKSQDVMVSCEANASVRATPESMLEYVPTLDVRTNGVCLTWDDDTHSTHA